MAAQVSARRQICCVCIELTQCQSQITIVCCHTACKYNINAIMHGTFVYKRECKLPTNCLSQHGMLCLQQTLTISERDKYN